MFSRESRAIRTGVGDLFTIMGCMNSALSLASRKIN